MSKSTVFRVNIPAIQVVEGIVYGYDDDLGVWVSSHRLSVFGTKKGRAKNIYLRLVDGQSSMINGVLLSRKALLRTVVADSEGTQDWTLEVRKNGDATPLYSLVALGGSAFIQSANIELDQGDRLQLFCNTTNFFGIQNPTVWVEIAWREETLDPP